MTASFDLTGRVALVTGGAQGLGASIAGALAGSGASVALLDIQAVFSAIAAHRLKPAGNTTYRSAAELCQHVLDTVAIP